MLQLHKNKTKCPSWGNPNDIKRLHTTVSTSWLNWSLCGKSGESLFVALQLFFVCCVWADSRLTNTTVNNWNRWDAGVDAYLCDGHVHTEYLIVLAPQQSNILDWIWEETHFHSFVLLKVAWLETRSTHKHTGQAAEEATLGLCVLVDRRGFKAASDLTWRTRLVDYFVGIRLHAADTLWSGNTWASGLSF